MELYTVDRNFLKQETIDSFESVIWTERYYGDGDFELKIKADPDMMAALPEDQLIMCDDSDEPQILEEIEIKDGFLTGKGISLTKWFNNRFFRTYADHAKKEYIHGTVGVDGTDSTGEVVTLIFETALIDNPWISGSGIGIASADVTRMYIPGLVVGLVDISEDMTNDITIPFGPVYDVGRQIAEGYEIGMYTNLDFATDAGYQLSFNTYKGEDRTSDQSVNDVVQLSAEMDTFTNVTDLIVTSDYKNLVYTFASGAPAGYMTLNAGKASSVPGTTNGFDLKASQEFDDFDTTGKTTTEIQALLNEKSKVILGDFKLVKLVDGELVQTADAKYGEHFFMGDVIEVVGNTGILQKARITEYIRAQDSAGEKSYPALTMIDE